MTADREKQAECAKVFEKEPAGGTMREIVHSLNNVLAVIQLNASMALESRAGEDAMEEIGEILDAVARGRELVRDLSDMQHPGPAVCRAEESASRVSPALNMSGGMAADRSGEGAKILFVDDEVELARLGQRLLLKNGYRVEFFTDSQAALERFAANPQEYALVITDQNMPGLKGSELAHRILQVRPEMPILLCTGFSAGIARRNLLEQGFCGLLVKPYQPKELLSAVRGVIA